MAKYMESEEHIALLEELKQVRASTVEHYFKALELARERRKLILRLMVVEGFSQADIARELGVTRQAIHKMIRAGREPRGPKAKS